jgi:hypothetical protein
MLHPVQDRTEEEMGNTTQPAFPSVAAMLIARAEEF